jgi:DNA-binding transcriptional LysR family regulator
MSCIPQILQSAEEMFPDTHIELTIDYNANLVRKLNARALDIAFLIDPEDQPFLAKEYLGTINQTWVGSAKQGWSDRLYHARDLADQVVFTLPDPAVPIVHDWFEAGGVKPTRVSLCNTLGMTAQLIAAGLGIGILPRGIALGGLQAGTLTEIRTSPSVQPASPYLVYLDRFRFRFRKILAEARAIVAKQLAYL